MYSYFRRFTISRGTNSHHLRPDSSIAWHLKYCVHKMLLIISPEKAFSCGSLAETINIHAQLLPGSAEVKARCMVTCRVSSMQIGSIYIVL